MSVHPIEIAVQVAGEREPRKPRWRCSKEFNGTKVCSVILSTPLLIWIISIIVGNVVESNQEPLCDRLLSSDPTSESIAAIVLIMVFIAFCAVISVPFGDRFATVALWLVFSASISLLSGFPNVDDKTSLGIFGDRPALVRQNNSEYWKNTIKSCVCETEACENYVYRNYMINFYSLDDFCTDDQRQCFNYSGYELSSSTEFEKPKRNETSAKNEDSTSPISSSRYHEVCFSKSGGDKGIKRLCYSCSACEEKDIEHELRRRWRNGNKLFIMTVLLVATNLIVFLAEFWARYMDTYGIQ